MSCGERSCKSFGGCTLDRDPGLECHVDCHGYESNGRDPDSTPKATGSRFKPDMDYKYGYSPGIGMALAIMGSVAGPDPLETLGIKPKQEPKKWEKGNAAERKAAEKDAKRQAYLAQKADT